MVKIERQQPLFSKRAILIILASFSALLLIVLFPVIRTTIKASATTRTLVKADLTAGQNFGHLSGKDLYAYNGMAFYKVNITTNKVTSLSTGRRLPVVDEMFWANSRGALMTFKASFGQTPVEETLRSSGKLFTTGTQFYAWYLDFASGKLTLVNTLPLGEVYYSDADSGFFFTSSLIDLSGAPAEVALRFYNVKTGKTQLISKDIGLRGITGIQTCGKVARLCIIGRNKYDKDAGHKLYGLGNDGKVSRLFNSKGVLRPTANPALFVSTPLPEQEPVEEPSNETVGSGTLEASEQSYVYNVETKSLKPLNFTVPEGEVAIDFSDPGQGFVVGGIAAKSQAASYHTVSVDKSGQAYAKAADLRFGDGKAFTGSVLGLSGSGDSKTALLKTAEGGQLLFSTVADEIKPVAAQQRSKTNASIKQCLKVGSALRYSYLDSVRTYDIYFNDDNLFALNIAKFSNCMVRNDPAAMIGYNYKFASVDPGNGYTTSD